MPADLPAPPLSNSYWVLPGKLLAGEHPRRGATPGEARERLRQLMDIGIDCFVDLTMPEELDAYEQELPAGVQYERRPIRDHSIPARPEHMLETLASIERALKAGRQIYLHCHAGIGRTGMVAGCLLAQRGRPGQEALDELNRLWQQCVRSQSWAYVPETEEQIDFVLNWRPAAPARRPAKATPAPAAAKKTATAAPALRGEIEPVEPVEATAMASAARAPSRNLRERFQGALVGLAIGDALAAATQGRKAGSFDPVTDLVGGGPFELPAGAWSDDTAMALCLAESLLERDDFDVRDQMGRYTRWSQEGYLSSTGQCVGITPSTARALSSAQWRRQIFAGSHDPKQLDPEVLSRVAPAVMFAFGSPERAMRTACDAARTTCQAPAALETCQVFAALIYGALAGESKARVLQPDAALLDSRHFRPKVVALLRQANLGAARSARAGRTVVDALAAALWAFQTTENFRDGALCAANLGGHSDVITAAYGQLAGAYYGIQAIPAAWRNILAHRALIAGFAERLFAHAQTRPIG